MLAKLLQGDHTAEFAFECDIHHVPTWLRRVTVGIEVWMCGIEGRWIGISLTHDAYRADHPWNRATRVIEEGAIALLHLIAQEIPRLVVTYTVPTGGLVGAL